MKKILPIIVLVALFFVLPELKDKLKDQGISTPSLKMEIVGVPKQVGNVITIIGLGLLGLVIYNNKS
jgi:type II secretory pathway component PulF